MRPVTCPRCGQPGQIELHDPVELTLGTVAVLLERRPLLTCRSGHQLVPAAAHEAAATAIATAVPRSRLRWPRRERCGVCDGRLTMPVRRTVRPVSVESGELPVLTIHLDLPMTRCPDCGVDQVPARSHGDVDAIPTALFGAERG
ncbi:MAG: hypothetical protein ACLFRD_03510 [Nitriliruptoraceae bacterium]